MGMRDYSTIHLDLNSGKGTALIFFIIFFAVLHFTVPVGSSTMSNTHTNTNIFISN